MVQFLAAYDTHPDLPHSALKLAQLFRAKDAVEKDFQTIKSAVKLRPIYHRTDPKVQAHVTLCMLALLLQRTLEHLLCKAKCRLSFQAAIEILRTCHLNRVHKTANAQTIYLKTAETVAQREILEALDLVPFCGSCDRLPGALDSGQGSLSHLGCHDEGA